MRIGPRNTNTSTPAVGQTSGTAAQGAAAGSSSSRWQQFQEKLAPNHALRRAAKAGDVDKLSKVADPNAPSRKGHTAVHNAARFANVDALKLLLRPDRGGDPNVSNRFTRKTALHYAIDSGDAATLEVLRDDARTRVPPEQIAGIGQRLQAEAQHADPLNGEGQRRVDAFNEIALRRDHQNPLRNQVAPEQAARIVGALPAYVDAPPDYTPDDHVVHGEPRLVDGFRPPSDERQEAPSSNSPFDSPGPSRS